MTNEQWLIYLYGIYPEGGLSIAMLGVTVTLWLIMLPFLEMITDKAITKMLKFNKIVTVITVIVLIIGYFIPPKNVFFTMIAAPYVKESLIDDKGKLHKLNNIIDSALTKADNYLNDNNRSK